VQRQQNNNPNVRQYTEAEKGKKKVNDNNSSTTMCTQQNKNQTVLDEVRKDVVNALASARPNSEEYFLTQQNDPTFKKFIIELASSNSDKYLI
jgi:cell fate (sporulation/competence/biofilm development) regulator YlbF (YheA/YmcA/DUF963 family)